MNTAEWLNEVDLFMGAASVQAARCYASCPRPAEGREWRFEGTVRGPFSTRARTLPATATLSDSGPGSTLSATASIPDPCFWTPDNPALYDVQLRLLNGTREIASVRRTLGLRRLGAHERSFRFESKRWVLRGVSLSLARNEFPQESAIQGDSMRSVWEDLPWRDQNAVLVAERLTAVECERAERDGRLIAAWVRVDQPGWQAELRRLSRSAAVAFAILAGDSAALENGESPRSLAPNICLLQSFGAGEPVIPTAWAQGVVVETGTETETDPFEFARRVSSCKVPIVAYRPFAPLPEHVLEWTNGAHGTHSTQAAHGNDGSNVAKGVPEPSILWASRFFSAARAAVDALQRDLAPAGDYAGYLV
jgi:hypothetical protein